MSVNGKTRESNTVESTIFRFLSRLGAAAYYCKKPGPFFYIGDFREFLRRCFGRMTISGSGILSIVNCFLASLGLAQFFLRFVPADRPRSICSRLSLDHLSHKSIRTSTLIAGRLDFRPVHRTPDPCDPVWKILLFNSLTNSVSFSGKREKTWARNFTRTYLTMIKVAITVSGINIMRYLKWLMQRDKLYLRSYLKNDKIFPFRINVLM